MKKQLLTKWVSGVAVVVLTCVCMVLLFAEPAQCEHGRSGCSHSAQSRCQLLCAVRWQYILPAS